MQHRHPGKSTHTDHAHDQDHGHGHPPVPGKRTLVEQAYHGATASASSFGGGPEVSGSASKKITFHQGQVRVDETVSVSVSHGKGPVSLDLNQGGLSIGNDKMSFDVKSPSAAIGKGLGLSGAGATVVKNGTHKSAVTMSDDGYLGVNYSTSYTVKAHGWTATLSVSAFVGTKPPPKKKPHGIGKVIHAVEKVVAHVIDDVVDAGKAIVNSAPDWGPVLVTVLAAAAAAGTAIETG